MTLHHVTTLSTCGHNIASACSPSSAVNTHVMLQMQLATCKRSEEHREEVYTFPHL